MNGYSKAYTENINRIDQLAQDVENKKIELKKLYKKVDKFQQELNEKLNAYKNEIGYAQLRTQIDSCIKEIKSTKHENDVLIFKALADAILQKISKPWCSSSDVVVKLKDNDKVLYELEGTTDKKTIIKFLKDIISSDTLDIWETDFMYCDDGINIPTALLAKSEKEEFNNIKLYYRGVQMCPAKTQIIEWIMKNI